MDVKSAMDYKTFTSLFTRSVLVFHTILLLSKIQQGEERQEPENEATHNSTGMSA